MAPSTPCPMSILPKNAVTLPSACTAIQESSWVGWSGGLVSEPDWASASPITAGVAIVTTNAPAAFRRSRRAMAKVTVMTGSLCRARGAFDGAQNRHVRAAAAFETGETLADLGVGGVRLLLEERRRRHDPAVDAI